MESQERLTEAPFGLQFIGLPVARGRQGTGVQPSAGTRENRPLQSSATAGGVVEDRGFEPLTS